MKQIEARCPTCGPVLCTSDRFDLRVCTYSPASYYEFACPGCAERIRKQADERAVEILIAEGVAPLVWHLPAEALEPREGLPLTHDDVLDFMLAIEKPDWIDQLTKVS